MSIPDPIVNYFVAAFDFKSEPREDGLGELCLVVHGHDCPGRLLEIIDPFSSNGVDINSLDYARHGERNEHFRLQLTATGIVSRLETASSRFVKHPLSVSVSKKRRHKSLVFVFGFFMMEIELVVADMPGVLFDFCQAIHGKPDCDANAETSILRLTATVVNDANFPEGGVPGFKIRAQIGCQSIRAVKAMKQRLLAFRDDKVTLWSQVQNVLSFAQTPRGPLLTHMPLLLSEVEKAFSPATMYQCAAQ